MTKNKLSSGLNHLQIAFFFIFLITGKTIQSQMLPSLALAGGPSIGWHFNPTDELNTSLKNAGFPEISKNGFLTLGGGGFVDLPFKKNFLRFGGLGVGFNSKESAKINDTLSKSVNYAFGMGGISAEFVKVMGRVDLTFGILITTGTLKIDLYQYGSTYGNYNTIFGEYTNNSSSSSITRNFKMRFYSFRPQIGIGLLVYKFAYLKLDAGYMLTTQGSWKVDDDVEVKNFPDAIKANGFMINLGLNFGLFFRD